MPPLRRQARSRLSRWVVALALALTATTVRAEDYWLEFQPLQPAPGGELSVSLWLGKNFIPEAQQAMQQARTVALRHITRAGDIDLLPRTRDGVTPLLRLQLAQPGGHLLSLERDAARVQLRARNFNRYLEDEGLLAQLEARKRAGEQWSRGRERYTRYVKAFVQVGEVADGISTRVLGQRLELVPERDLAGLKVGEKLGVRVLFEGRPLAGAQVEAGATHVVTGVNVAHGTAAPPNPSPFSARSFPAAPMTHRIALTSGEPAGIGPELLVRVAQHAWPFRAIAIADRRCLHGAAARLGLPLTLVEDQPENRHPLPAGQLDEMTSNSPALFYERLAPSRFRLGIAAKGTGNVEVEAIDPDHPDAVAAGATEPRPQMATQGPVYVQAGSFASRDNAVRLRERLEAAGFDDLYLDRVLMRGELFHRVRLGPFDSVDAADALIQRLAAIGIRAVSTQVE